MDPSDEVPPFVDSSTASDVPPLVETSPLVNSCLSISPSDLLEDLLGKPCQDLPDALEEACDSELSDPDDPSEGDALPDLEAIAAPWEAYDEWFDSLASPSAESDGMRVSHESQDERAELPFDEEEAWSSLAWGEAMDDSFGGAVHEGDEGTRVGDVVPSAAAIGEDVLFANEIVTENPAMRAPLDGADAVAELEDSIESGEGLEPNGSTSSALEAAGILESIARRVRAGELPLEAIAAGSGDEALLASVLATLLRRR
jgi:hypothetical protein